MYNRIPPDTESPAMTSNALFHKKPGGKGRGAGEKGKDKLHYYTKNVTRKK